MHTTATYILAGFATVALVWFAAGLHPYLSNPDLWPSRNAAAISIGQGLVGATMALCLTGAAVLVWRWLAPIVGIQNKP